ncbi:MAG: hypothetical protein JRE43_06045 [Deltaproteobacteria bacterium]|jgi:hypothetical protein|nr:hypothetical protein [Deltaproteobacteria bacterium]MBW2543782.1 hypothetical protein [Deltaproteobacteria bacterium]
MQFTKDSSPLTKTLTDPILALFLSAILITPAATAYADEEISPEQNDKKIKRVILASLDDPELAVDSPDESSWIAGFRVSKKGPIQFRRTLQIGDDEVLFKLYGPLVKKKPGMRFKVQGLRFGDNPVNIEGYGNTKGGGVRFSIRY